MAANSFGYNSPPPSQRGGGEQDYDCEDRRTDSPKKMANPYKDPNVQLPYQISQNTYKKHFYTDHDGPIPRNTKHFFTDRVDPSEREQLPYPAAGGRPDMGFYKEDPSSVPYPQEPDRRHRMEYMPPPEIGFNPYKEQQATEAVDYQPRSGEPRKLGWFLLLRYHNAGHAQVRHALTMSYKNILDDKGEVLGIAKHHTLSVKEGGMGWLTYGRVSDRPTHNILVMRFERLEKAVQWFDRDYFFKQKDFPERHTLDCMALPEHESCYGRTAGCDSVILTEYNRIAYADFFRDEFAIPTENLIKGKYRGCPYIVRSTVVPYVNATSAKDATPLRGSWMRQNSIVTMSFMPSKTAVDEYFRDPEFLGYQHRQNRVSDPTTVTFTLENWKL